MTCQVIVQTPFLWFCLLIFVAALRASLFVEALDGGSETAQTIISPSKSLVWGPGIENGSFALPVRWFYLQMVDETSGQNFTANPFGKAHGIQVNLYTISGRRAPAHVQVLDRHDGSFLIRYRLRQSQKEGIEIRVDSSAEGGGPIAQSPYVLKGPIRHEECDCPQSDHWGWRRDLECPTDDDAYAQMASDLANTTAIDLEQLNSVSQKLLRSRPVCHYTILNNRLYRRCGPTTDFRMFSDEFLLSLMRKVKLPDMEFVFNLGDYPVMLGKNMKDPDNKDGNGGNVPIISWCGSDDSLDIVVPTWDIIRSVIHGMGRQALDVMSVQSMDRSTNASSVYKMWQDMDERALWRGRDSRRERLELIELSRRFPHLIDAGLTAFFFFRSESDLQSYGPKVEHMSFHDFFNYKYQLNLDGTVAAYRLPYLLAGPEAVIFKQESPYYEHFYSDLVPFKHYIPFKRNLSDLIELLQWAHENDQMVHDIGKHGRDYAREALLPNRIYCYYERLLREYATMQRGQVEIRSGMESVSQPTSGGYGQYDCDGAVCPLSTEELKETEHDEL